MLIEIYFIKPDLVLINFFFNFDIFKNLSELKIFRTCVFLISIDNGQNST